MYGLFLCVSDIEDMFLGVYSSITLARNAAYEFRLDQSLPLGPGLDDETERLEIRKLEVDGHPGVIPRYPVISEI